MAYGNEITVEKLRLLRSGFIELREGSLYAIIGDLLGLTGLAVIVAYIGFPLSITINESPLESAAPTLLIGAAVALVGIIISIIGLIRWKNSGKYFREFDPLSFSSADTGPALMLWGSYLVVLILIVFIAGVLVLSFGAIVASLILALAAGILVFIGAILFGVFLLKIKNLRLFYGLNVPDFTVDAVLWFLGILFEVLYIVAEIIIYIHSGEALTAIIVKEREMTRQGSQG